MARTQKTRASDTADVITADLVAVLVAVTDGEPRIMTIANGSALPSGPFEFKHRSLQSGLRTWVEAQTGHPLGYVEQLYTFADRDRTGEHAGQHVISISYLGLTREGLAPGAAEPGWRSWYEYFPWEDHRAGAPRMIAATLAPALQAWAKQADDPELRRRIGIAGRERILDKFQLEKNGRFLASIFERRARS